jgi:hypothetical protein
MSVFAGLSISSGVDMKESQLEIKAIQARLQEISRNSPHRPLHPMEDGQDASAPSARAVSTQPSLPSNPYEQSGLTASEVELQPNDESDFQPNLELSSPWAPPAYGRLTPPTTQVLTPRSRQALTTSIEPIQDDFDLYRDVTLESSREPSGAMPSEAFGADEVEDHDPLQVEVEACLQRLGQQAEYVNQLAANQEAAVMQLKAIADEVEYIYRLAVSHYDPDGNPQDYDFTVCQYELPGVPVVEAVEDGRYRLTLRPLDLFRAEREAVVTAEKLRYFGTRSPQVQRGATQKTWQQVTQLQDWMGRSLQAMLQGARDWVMGPEGAPSMHRAEATAMRSPTSRRYLPTKRRQRARSQSISLQEGMLWIVGAALVRVGVDALLLSSPQLWPLVIGMIVVPAAIAIYRTTTQLQSGVALGYRLLFVLVGLLIGGRL